MSKKIDCLKLINFIENSSQFKNYIVPCRKILIAYSGGQDSTCLLIIFYILSKKYGFQLGIVYCNHGWTKSVEANLTVFNMVKQYKLPFYYVHINAHAIKKSENYARQWRYQAFEKILIHSKYDLVLTGHTLSDNAETVLFNLSRGCGLKGICGLKAVKQFKNVSTSLFSFNFQTMELIDFKKFFETFITIKKNQKFMYKCMKLKKFNTCFTFLFNQYLLSSYFQKISCRWSPYIETKNPAVKVKTQNTDSFITFFNPVTYLTIEKVFSFFLITQKQKTEVPQNNHLRFTEFLEKTSKKQKFQSQHLSFLKKSFFQHNCYNLCRNLHLTKNYNQLYFKCARFDRFLYFSNTLKKSKCSKKSHSKIQTFLNSTHLLTVNKQIHSLLTKKQKEKKYVNQYWLFKQKKSLLYKTQKTKLTKNSILLLQTKTKQSFLMVRPLLKVDRLTIQHFIKKLNLAIYLDPSNEDLTFTRNFVRGEIIPLLKEINAKAEQNIYKFSQIANLYYNTCSERICSSEKIDFFHG